VFKLNSSLVYGLLAAFLSSGVALAMDQNDILITPGEISELRQSQSNNPNLSLKPIQVDIFMSRSDGRFETLHDFYVKKDESSPITKEEVFENFSLKKFLPILLKDPSSSLFITIAAHIVGEKKRIDKDSIIDEEKLRVLLD
jgi:hypothetical protein